MRLNCFNCGCKYDASRSDQLFCSKWCRYKYHHRGDMIMTLKGMESQKKDILYDKSRLGEIVRDINQVKSEICKKACYVV